MAKVLTKQARSKSRSKIGLLLLAYIAFISLGLPDGLLGVAWPSMRREFGLPLDFLGIQMFAGMAGYLTSAFFSGRVTARLGVGRVLAISCLLTGFSLMGFTLAPAWAAIVFLSVFSGLGAGAIDASLNTYIASEHGESLMQWLHACWGVGITSGPIIMTAGLNNFDSWRWGYTVVAAAQITLGLGFALTSSMWKRQGTAEQTEEAVTERRLLDYKTPLRETLLEPRVWMSLLLFFIYVGIETVLGTWVYTLLTESRGIAPQIAGLWTGSYWATFTIGRILAGLYTRKVKLGSLMLGSILAALVGAALLLWNPSEWVSLAGVGITGFAIAPIFPGLVSETSARVTARHAANTIGFQICATGLGSAAVPALAGVIAESTTLEAIPIYLLALLVVLLGMYVAAKRPAV